MEKSSSSPKHRESPLIWRGFLPISPDFSQSKRDKVASDLRNALKTAIDESGRLNDDQKTSLKTSLSANPDKMQDLFRRSFKESLLELYKRAGLEVDDTKSG